MYRSPLLRITLASVGAVVFVIAGLFALDRPDVNAAVNPPDTRIKTVFLVLLENTSWSDVSGNAGSAPYINGTLLPQASRAEQFYNYAPGGSPSRPSETNYVWLEGGSTTYPDHTFTSNAEPSAANSTAVTDHLVSLMQAKGLSWKEYAEGISGTDCPLVNVGGPSGYQPKHNPFVFFQDVTNNNDPNSANCIAHIRPLTELATDLTNNTVANYNFITPNQCNASHDTCAGDRIKQGDTWLSNTIPLIMQSNAYKDNGAIFITWDENTAPRTDQIGMIVLSKLAKGGGYTNTIRYDHSSTLLTMQRIFNVLPPIRGAATATDLRDLFSDVTITGTVSTCRLVAAPYAVSANPIAGSDPITYVWQATGLSPVTHTNRGLTDTVDLVWALAGSKAVTVTTLAATGTFSATMLANVTEPVTQSLFIPIVNGPAGPEPTPTPPTIPSSGWTTVSSPAGLAFLSVSFAGNSAIWAAGTGGNVVKSTDDGLTFSKVDIGSNADFYGIKFSNASAGIAAGSGGRVRWTADGGATWATGTTGVGTDLASVTMVNSQTGWISGGGGVIIRTDDGGKTWTKQTSGFDGDINGIYFVDANTGWAVGAKGIILATTDGGTTWTRQKEPTTDTDSLSGVYFFDKQNGWAGGDPSSGPTRSNLWRTTNGGTTWAKVTVPIAGPAFTSIRFADLNRGWAAAEERFVLKTTDGGTTWTIDLPALQPSGQHYWLYGMDVRFDGLAIAVGGNYPSTGSFTPINGVIMRRGPGL